MKFTKYTGLGNDFVFLDGAEAQNVAKDPFALAVRMCDRRLGIGADGLILLLPTDKGDVRMRIINSDGSEAEMCGNASRCVALHWRSLGHSGKTVTLDTLAGPIITEIVDEEKGLVRVDMGEPRLTRGQIPMTGDPASRAVRVPVHAGEKEFIGTAVSMGNPHFVIFVEDISKTPLETWGPTLETCAAFPQKTNVEFVQILDKNTVRMRVWERGAGITQACGTGACATAAACVLNGRTNAEVTVKLDGGELQIAWPEQQHIFMTGPAKKVFTGDFIV